ncbi:multiple sugar transport system substrate-binding protein [Paenibacillus turicensis]|uniref:Multiple sugar transport system substrate-binding protein n=1 Tax=Paenibacillus turicensis TaxID=160487 RepID=A0ABS4FXW6_9BACL|nr:extracellular solute-binding protein [Paenibacillus turicensis]MBP1907183.1 multiple sugar transport system substrate-binding protein [Paenibacillus turicensis]
MKFKRLHKIVMILTCILLVAGCTSPSGQNKNEEKRTVKIMFWDESYFYQQYGDLFSMKFPNTEVEIVSTNNLYDRSDESEEFDYNKALAKFIDKEQPDVLLVNAGAIKKLVADGKLAELQPLIDRDKYDMTTYSQGILESIKEMGDGKLFALSPKFSSNGIIYNADLFKKYSIEPPHDGMTWQEILDLARRFPTDGTEKERIYGYGSQYNNNLSELASTIANEQGLKFYNGQTKQITLNTDAWKNVYKMAADAIASKAIYTVTGDGFQGGSMEEYYASQPFLMGRMAMTVGGSHILENIKQAADNMKDYKSFEIGVAAGPVDPSDPTTTNNAYINELFAIRAGSPNADAAWDFVKFVNGEEFAKIKSKTLNNGLPTREGISKEYKGISLEAFYKLKPKMALDSDNELTSIPSSFYEKYQPIMAREIKLLEENKKTVDEALNTIQTEAQAALDQAFKDQEAEKAQKDKK